MRISDWSSDVCSSDLGPIEAGATVPFFTTPANGFSAQSTPSRIDVTGKVTLSGKVLVDVTKDAIYSAGDGYTLFTYGDTDSAVSATVNQSISSPFVSFDLTKADATKTVKIVANHVEARKSEERRLGKECGRTGKTQ